MKIFALETSAKAVSVAVTDDGRVLASAYQDNGLTHSRTLMPLAESLFKGIGRTPRDMDAFAVAVGPGSFTGVRIGVAAAKGFAFGADRPAVGVSTLSAMARNVAFSDGLILCAMDARRNQIYEASFRAENGVLTRLTPDRAISLSDLAEELSSGSLSPELSDGAPPVPPIVVGDGANLCADYLNARGVPCRIAPPHLIMQNAVSVALEAESASASQFVAASELRPVYLRPPQAVPLRERVNNA